MGCCCFRGEVTVYIEQLCFSFELDISLLSPGS